MTACPFCSRFADIVALRAVGIEVRLKSARDREVFALYPEAHEYDLDLGILVRWRGKWAYGAEAMSLISTLVAGVPASALLRHRTAARRLYPLLRFARRVALLLKGVPLIAAGNARRGN